MIALHELFLKNRSYRRFHEDVSIPVSDLKDMISNARLSASARNAQVIKYIISNDPAKNELIFPCLAWAGYLKDWPGPEPGERPSAYIIMLLDTKISKDSVCDEGIAAQSILLTAVEKGYGGCIIGSVKRDTLASRLNLEGHFRIIQAVALGKPKEQVVIESVKNGDIRYWRDDQGVHHVPKRSLDDILLQW